MDLDKEAALALIQDSDRPATERRDALSWLLAKKVLKDVQPVLNNAINAWLKTAVSHGTSASDRFIATSEIVRIVSANPGLSEAGDDALSRALETPLADLAEEADGDTRANVAKGLRRVAPPWAGAYAFRALASEDKSDRVRAELIDLVIATQPTLSSLLSGLASHFEQRAADVGADGKPLARRTTKVTEALRTAFAASDIEAGDESGEELDRFVRVAARCLGKKAGGKVAEDLTIQVIRFVQTLVRSRFSLALEPATYAAIRRASGFFLKGAWPKSLRPYLSGLERDILEAIVLLGRQGVTSRALHEQLVVVTGSREEAKGRTERVALEHSELSEDVKFFLTHWQVRASSGPDSSEVQDAVLVQVDTAIADALIESGKIRAGIRAGVSSHEDFAEAAAAIEKSIAEIAKRRRIEFLGLVGESMRASPKYFSSESGLAEGIVKSQAVVRIRADGTPGVCLVKGVIE